MSSGKKDGGVKRRDDLIFKFLVWNKRIKDIGIFANLWYLKKEKEFSLRKDKYSNFN